MKLHFSNGQDIIFVDKPAGLNTHASEPGRPGLVEIYENRLNIKLWVCHRLDQATTGTLVFATSKEKAELLRQAFEKHQVEKVYWFLTDRKSSFEEAKVTGHIEKLQGRFVCHENQPDNSLTLFKRIKRSPFFELWEARPESGKPHQIRLHAEKIGLPILGDTVHGGSTFPHLCLHALSIKLPNEALRTSPAPRFFERLGLLKDPDLIQILSAIDKRQRLFGFLSEPNQCLRLTHNEIPRLAIDKLGSQLWVHWYNEQPPREKDLERFEFLATNLKSSLILQLRKNRGSAPTENMTWLIRDPANSWTAGENDLVFEFRNEQGLSAGLFLDQRLNRKLVQDTSCDLDVLNLFAYTGGFSLAAAKGRAKTVTTVDLSKSFLAWAKANFELNSLPPANYEWWATDSFVFLEGARKRKRKWDLIICDPPSFARIPGEKKPFVLKEAWPKLLQLMLDCLSNEGKILFSNNLESYSQADWTRWIESEFPKLKTEVLSSDLDYELPHQEQTLKAFWITRRHRS